MNATIQAEQQTLAAIINGGDFNAVVSRIAPDDFLCEQHRIIFEACLSVSDVGDEISPITIMRDLEWSKRKTSTVNGALISEIMNNSFAFSGNAEKYAEIVRGFSIKRKLASTLKAALEISAGETGSPKQIIEMLQREFEKLSDASSKDLVLIGNFGEEFTARLTSMEKGERGIVGLSTGFPDLDAATSGLGKGELVILAARPAMGKTALAMEVLMNAGAMKKPSIFVSLEMSGSSIYSRLACSEARVNLQKFRVGSLTGQEIKDLRLGSACVQEAPIFLVDNAVSGTDINGIRSLIRKAVRHHGAEIAVIDFLQLCTIKGHRGNRENEISTISRSLKQLARELEIPVLALSQLSRECEKRDNKRPLLSDLRESGAIEQDADLVLFLYRDEYYRRESQDKGICEAIIGKQRNGPTATVRLQFTSAYAKFGNLDQNRAPEPEYAPKQNSWFEGE